MSDNKVIPLTDIGLDENKVLMKETKGIIYKITNTVNGKVYIGQTTRSFVCRYNNYFTNCHNEHLNNSISKYGLDKFTVEILYKNLNSECLNFYETEMINYYDSKSPEKGYNKAKGGVYGNPSSKRVKAIYKGEVIIKDSVLEFSEYMESMYGFKKSGVKRWFSSKGLAYEYIEDFESIGYLNYDGSVSELNRVEINHNIKKVKAVYKGDIILKDSLVEFSRYMEDIYKIRGAYNWFYNGLPYEFVNDFKSIGYVDEDGSVKELKRSLSGNKKKVKAIYKGDVIIKDSKAEFSKYMKDVYGIKGCSNWFTNGLPNEYIGDFQSIGYLNIDGSVDELIRKENICFKKVKAIYKGEVIVKDSREDFSQYMANTYGFQRRGLLAWFQKGLPFAYCQDFESIGYLKEDGTVEELKRNLKSGTKLQKKVRAIYKGEVIVKDSLQDFIRYMQETYDITPRNVWFSKGLPYKYANDFESIGYLKEDGTVEELKRKSKKGVKHQKKVRVIYKGEVIEKDSVSEFIDFITITYGIQGVGDWFYRGIPYKYSNDFRGLEYIKQDSYEEIKSNSLIGFKVKSIYKGEVIIKDSLKEFSIYMDSTYGIKGVTGWFKNGLPYKYVNDFESIGYLNNDGKVEELRRNIKIGKARRVRAIYKGDVIVKNSIAEFSRYMKDTYAISNTQNWFNKGVSLNYVDDFESIGYLNDDGSVVEIEKKRINNNTKKVKAIYKGDVIIKDSIVEFNRYMMTTYNMSVINWFKSGVLPIDYIKDFTSIGYLNNDGTVKELERSIKGNTKKVKAVYKGDVIIKDSISSFSRYMKDIYGLRRVNSWFGENILPYKYIKDFESIGYLKEDGTVEELKRKKLHK